MTTSKNIDDNSFTISSITYEISDKEKKEVVIKSIPGLFGEFTSYGGSKKCELQIDEVIIPAHIEYKGIHYTVTGVLHSVFDGCDNVKRIIFPSTINRIEWSFWECFALETFEVASDNPNYCDVDGVLFNKNKTELIAYPNKKGAQYIVPENVRKLGSRCFKSCRDLKNISLPDTLRYIGPNVFYDCHNLEEVNFPSRLLEVKCQRRAPKNAKYHYNGDNKDIKKRIEDIKNPKY